MSAGLEIRGVATGLLDEPLLLRTRGGSADESISWRARHRDDQGRVWRATADSARELSDRWALGKAAGGSLAALQSLRPVSIDVRAELSDGRGCNRTLTRSLVGEGVRVRRWRDGLTATLYLPAPGASCATAMLDSRAGTRAFEVATLAAALLASRGVLALVVGSVRVGRTTEQAGTEPASVEFAFAAARERLLAVPSASSEIQTLAVADPFIDSDPGQAEAAVLLPPGIGIDGGAQPAELRATAWDALLGRLGARPRGATTEVSPASGLPETAPSGQALPVGRDESTVGE
jgi:hypothetical protein